jgi:hypothetical protein
MRATCFEGRILFLRSAQQDEVAVSQSISPGVESRLGLLTRSFKIIKTDQWHLFLVRGREMLGKGRGMAGNEGSRQGVERTLGV